MSTTTAAPKYTVSDLGLLDHVGSSARAVNEQGDVIGTLGSGGRGGFSPQSNHSFLWSNGKTTDFGRSRAVLGINNKGQMAGIKYLPGFASDFSPLKVSPILYESRKWKSIPANGTVSGSAVALNDFGQAVCQLCLDASQPNKFSAVVFRDTEVQRLEIPDRYISGVVKAINNEGQTVGFLQEVVSESLYRTHAVLWDKNGLTQLGSLPDSDLSEAVAINKQGHILCTTTFNSSKFQKYIQELYIGKTPGKEESLSFGGFLWDNGKLIALITPDDQIPGIDVSKSYLPRSLNDADVVVGRATGSDGKHVAFVWQDRKMTDLNTLISSDSGWTLTEARGLNNQGQIVGDGKYNGQTHAFLLTPF